jgi:hypothetical protein
MLSLGRILYTAKGCHGWYKQVNESIGVKIYEELTDSVSLEYLITKYVSSLGIRCTQALGFGTAQVGIKNAFDKAEDRDNVNLRVKRRPVMWMEHIEGVSLQQVIDKVIEKCPADITSYDAKYDWAWQQQELLDVLSQFDNTVRILQKSGLSLDDHLENYDNFLVDNNGLLHIIDFSFEAEFIDGKLAKKIKSATKQYLEDRLPPEPYLSELIKSGLVKPTSRLIQ